jgi:hypothetical protein
VCAVAVGGQRAGGGRCGLPINLYIHEFPFPLCANKCEEPYPVRIAKQRGQPPETRTKLRKSITQCTCIRIFTFIQSDIPVPRVARNHEAPGFEGKKASLPLQNRAETCCGLAIRPLDKDYDLNQQIPQGILLGLSSSSKGIKDSNGQIAKVTTRSIRINIAETESEPGFVWVVLMDVFAPCVSYANQIKKYLSTHPPSQSVMYVCMYGTTAQTTGV